MSNIFETVAFPKHKRNLFNLSHMNNLSLKFGQLIPFYCDEVLPGDTFNVQTDVFLRVMPMLAPLMHQVNVFTHYFFVPNRLVWDEWKDFITGGEDGTANPDFPFYVISKGDAMPGSLCDYLGFGADGTHSHYDRSISALPLRAYNLIYNEYYRDQNLQEELDVNKNSGQDTNVNYIILNRNWEKDYFTSSLPWTQRGPTTQIPMNLTNQSIPVDFDQDYPTYIIPNESHVPVGMPLFVNQQNKLSIGAGGSEPSYSVIPKAEINSNDIANNLTMSINDLRTAIATQKWLENNARGGSRYIEQIFSHFGVTSSDARLQRPEFLGGSIQPVSISEVLQTSASTENSDLGDMAGHGISAGSSKSFKRFFEEHGLIIGIMSVMPRTSYTQGTKRFLLKRDKFDFAWPEFSNLGEQPVYTAELFHHSNADAKEVFGYQSRYAEYKYKPNEVHGVLKNEAFAPWTLYRKFFNKPVLNNEFIEVDSDAEELGRIFPLMDGDVHFIAMVNMKIKALRKLPKHVIPDI